jgi:hypothetical protein
MQYLHKTWAGPGVFDPEKVGSTRGVLMNSLGALSLVIATSGVRCAQESGVGHKK